MRLISRAWLLLPLLVLLAACGGGEEPSAAEPRLPSVLAEDLAQRSEAVAALLRAGDACAAASEAESLVAAVEAAIAQGRVPGAFQDELVRTTRTLRAAINCEPESTPPATVNEAETGETTTQPPADPCAQLEQELGLLEEQKQQLEERKQELEQEFKDDKDERERQKELLEEEKQALEEQKKALEEALRACEEQE